MFSVHTTSKEFKNEIIAGRGNLNMIVTPSFYRKAPFQNGFHAHENEKQIEERFQKAPFSWRNSVDG